MKKGEINELFSKRPADITKMIEDQNNPSKEDILNHRDFQTNLINDLISGKKNITGWNLIEQQGSIKDLDSPDDRSFDVNYNFNFKYSYKNIPVDLSLFISGRVDVTKSGNYVKGDYFNEPQYPSVEVDDRSLGQYLDLALFDEEGNEVSLTWLTPELKQKVVANILHPYL